MPKRNKIKTKTIQIIGNSYTVQYINKEDAEHNFFNQSERLMGDCNYQDLIIRVDASMNKQQQDSTLLHEILHAVSDALAIELTENQVKRLESGLMSVLKSNKNLFETI